MMTVGFVFRRTCLMIAVVSIAVLGTRQAHAQLGKGDIVLGRSVGPGTAGAGNPTGDSFRVYDKSSGTWSPGPGWTTDYIQSVEFDNSGGLSHNARGNLFGADFGSTAGFDGFTLYNFATDGSNHSEKVWGIVDATGGTTGTDPMGAWLIDRGGGVSFSPDNKYLAWTNYDSGQIYVHDYSPGATPGTGSGATLSGPRRTGLGDGNGNPGSLTALAVNPSKVTQGTAWLSNTKLVAFDGYGELITLDVSGIAGGTEDGTLAGFQPTEMTNWKIENTEVTFNAQFTDIEYNAEVDPNHIYASVNIASTFETQLFAYDYNPSTGAISLNKTLDVPNTPNTREPREIALDADGNLFFSGYAGSGSDNIIMELPNATDVANWNEANVAVFYSSPDYTSFNGMDVAVSEPTVEGLLGDYNENNVLDAADYTVWRDALAVGGTIPNDPTGGIATQDDYDYWKAHFGATLGSGAGAIATSAVPEPGSFALVILLSLAGTIGLPRLHVRAR